MSAKPNPLEVILLSIMGVVVIFSIVGHINGTEYTPEVKTTYHPAPVKRITTTKVSKLDTALFNKILSDSSRHRLKSISNPVVTTTPVYYYPQSNSYTYDELQEINSSLEYDLNEANDKIEELENRVTELEAEANE